MGTSTHSIRFKEDKEEKLDLVAAKLEEGVFWKDSGMVIYGWRNDGKVRTIKIKNVSPEVGQKVIWEMAEEWGEVLDVRQIGGGSFGYKWKEMMSGSLVVRVRMAEGVEPEGFKMRCRDMEGFEDADIWQIVWRGQKDSGCYKCGQVGHIGARCQNGKRTYA